MAKSELLDPDLWRFGPTFDMVVGFRNSADAYRFVDGVLGCDQVTRIDEDEGASGVTADNVRAILRDGAIEVGFMVIMSSDEVCLVIYPGFLARAIGEAARMTWHMTDAPPELVELHRVLLCLYAHADPHARARQVILQEETWSFRGFDAEGVTLHAAVARGLGFKGAAVDEGVRLEWEVFWNWARQSCRG